MAAAGWTVGQLISLRDLDVAAAGGAGVDPLPYHDEVPIESAATIEARQRADTLLTERLGPADAAVFRATGTIMRPSVLWPGLHYLLRSFGRVTVIRDGRLTAELCVVQVHAEPEADRLMAILDWIEADERRLWQMANVTGTWPEGEGPQVSANRTPQTPNILMPPFRTRDAVWSVVVGCLLAGIVGSLTLVVLSLLGVE